MILDLLPTEDPRLRQPSLDVTAEDLASKETQKFLDDMIATMKAQKSLRSSPVGLAAPQVGVNKRIIIVDPYGDGLKVFINARITSLSPGMTDSPEGCYSVPGVWGVVRRHKKAHLKALDRQGKKVAMKVSGFEAIVFQHEIDHTDGILFIDRDPVITKDGAESL
ncbi:MAG: peptide deformylase [Patescibacteria group bacterium]